MRSCRLAATLALGAACLGSSAWGGEEVDQSEAVDPAGIVQIINPRGEVDVYGWDRAEVRVDGELDDLAESLTFEVNGATTLVEVTLPEQNVNWGDGSELAIYVPAGGKLKIDAVSTDIEVEGVTGPIAIRTVSGDVEVEGIGSRTQINTVSGDVEVSEGIGMLKVVTSSGDFQADIDATSVSIDTMTGDVELRLGDFDTLDLIAVSSTLEVEGHLNPAGRISAETVSGDIELRLTEVVNAQIRARVVAGGEIDNDLTDAEPERQRSNLLLLKTTSGDGNGEIQLSTVSGTIDLEPAEG